MDVLQIPMQSVVQIGSDFYCWVLIGTKLERRKLKIGDSNDTDIEILDGVEENELTVMNPRSKFSDEIASLEEAISSNVKNEPIRQAIDPSLMQSSGKQMGADRKSKGGRPPAVVKGERKPGSGNRKPAGAGNGKKPSGKNKTN